MPKAFRTSLFALVALVPAIAMAAPAKKARKTVTTTTVTTEDAAPAARRTENQSTLFGSTGGNGMAALKGLSLFAAYDFADQIETNNVKVDTERAFDIGAMYEVPQFTPGIAAQGGAEYDFSRSTKAAQGQGTVKYSQIALFGELTGRLTNRFKVMGGLNYNFPSADNLAQGTTMKGNVGYQFGASFAFNDHIALDGRYRSIQYEISGNGQSASYKQGGFVAAGRFMF